MILRLSLLLVLISFACAAPAAPAAPKNPLNEGNVSQTSPYWYCWSAGSALGQDPQLYVHGEGPNPHHPAKGIQNEEVCTDSDFYRENIQKKKTWHMDRNAPGGWSNT